MNFAAAESVAAAAVALRLSHPRAPALDVLDLLLQGRPGLAFPKPATLDAPLTGPRAPFGQVIAAGLDRGMSAAEWMAMTGPDADQALRKVLLEAWQRDVLPRFVSRYAVQLT